MSTPIADAQARQQALDPSCSFCVQAPAGSGKTELLTQRILNLLAHCESPEELLAFTFTRKAAAEMRNRLLGSLEKALTLSAEDLQSLPEHATLTMSLAKAVLARDQEKNWGLLHNSQRLRINTIDSFSSWLTTRLPLASGFGARPAISTDMQAIFETAVRDTLDAINTNSPYQHAVQNLIRHLHGNLQQAQNLLMELLYKRDQWLELVSELRSKPDQARRWLEDNLQVLLEETLAEAATRLQPFESDIMRLVNFAAEQKAALGKADLLALGFTQTFPDCSAQSSVQWQALASLFLLSDNSKFLGKPNKNHGFPGKSAGKDKVESACFAEMQQLFAATVSDLQEQALLTQIQQLAGLPPPSYPDAHWQMLSDLITLLPLLAARLQLAMSESGVIDHTQTSLAALSALGSESEPTDLALLLDYRIRHILVDEFQDTSHMQFTLLKLLTAGWNQEDGRTLFIVGDGMQSCYGFRNANVGLFLRAREQVGNVAMELLQLQVNFRSTTAVVDWVNHVFARAFPANDDIARGGVRYSSSQAREQTAVSAGVHCRLLIEPEENSTPLLCRRYEAQQVVELYQKLQSNNPADSVAILIRSRPCLDALVPALRQAGIRWNAEAIDPLLSYPPIRDLFTLLSALLNPADITAWYALLRSPLCGLALSDLELLARQKQLQHSSLLSVLSTAENLDELSSNAQLRLQRCMPALLLARKRIQLEPLAELLENLWLELGGLATLDKPDILDNVATFFHLLDQASGHGELPDLTLFEQDLQKSYGSIKDSSVKLQIMTIHKAKGLEFDHVILPALERSGKHSSRSLLLWQEYPDSQQHIRPLLGLVSSKGDAQDGLYSFLRDEAALRESLETTRLLYIAVTRAVSSAWLFGIVKQGKTAVSCAKNSLLNTVLPVLLAEPERLQLTTEQIPAADPGNEGSRNPDVQTHRSLPKDWHEPAASGLLANIEAAKPPEPTHDLMATVTGELVHLTLQYWVSHRQAEVNPDFTPAWWSSRLRPLCSDQEALQQALFALRRQLQSCLASEHANWLFREQHKDDHCELALTDYRSAYRKDYVIDRTFIDAEGTRWIIDYKSSSPAAQQNLQAFLEEQKERYQQQLQTYAELMQSLGNEPIRLALYFTALPLLYEIELQAVPALP